MPSQALAAYDHPAHFEPLLPARQHLSQLEEQSRPVVEASLKLQGSLHPQARAELRELVREMNSYYSNRIEGQSTHPLNIARALHADFSAKPDIARRQRVAVAHIQAEKELEALGLSEPESFASETLRKAHECLYGLLETQDRITDEGDAVVPGAWREKAVAVYRHEPPPAAAIPAFLQRADAFYVRSWGLDKLLVAAACSHHRLMWVHPFRDGNGRATRLQLHCMLHRLTDGLWSANRGLARKQDEYYLRLSEADMARQGDLDGRGNLSEKMLAAWCRFFIDVCRDQVGFMTDLLQTQRLKNRLAALVKIRAQEKQGSGYRDEAILPLHHVLVAGPLARGEFIQMTGLGESTARKTISQLVQDGLLKSDSHRSELRIAFPLDALAILFPNLYAEAASTVVDA